MSLFKDGYFQSHSGQNLPWKVECDKLTSGDWECLAKIVGNSLKFSRVEGVPRGGLKLANLLQIYTRATGGLLIVDDVFTTGSSMEKHRNGSLDDIELEWIGRLTKFSDKKSEHKFEQIDTNHTIERNNNPF